MNFGVPSAIRTEMADRFVASRANLPPPLLKIELKEKMILLKVVPLISYSQQKISRKLKLHGEAKEDNVVEREN